MHYMNKQRGAHMTGKPMGEASGDVDEHSGQHHAPHIHIHSHSQGHTVHVMHHDGTHTKSEHEHGDAEGIKSIVDQHIGGEPGQDHGFSSGEEMEDEGGYGPGV